MVLRYKYMALAAVGAMIAIRWWPEYQTMALATALCMMTYSAAMMDGVIDDVVRGRRLK